MLGGGRAGLNNFQPTIKSEFFKSSIVLSCIIVVIFGLLFSSILYYTGIDNVRALIKEKNSAASFFVAEVFTKIHNNIEFLSQDKTIQNALYLDRDARQKVLAIYQAMEKSDPDINYIYSGYSDGSLLINNYIPPPGFNSVVRPWYQIALKVSPKISDGLPYQEIKSKKWLVSVSKALVNNRHEVTGVVSIDCSIDDVAQQLNKTDKRFSSSYSYAVNRNNEIIIHPNSAYLDKTLSELCNAPIQLESQTGYFTYSVNGSEKFAFYSKVDSIGWTIITVVEKNEIFKPIVMQIVLTVLLTVVIAILLGWFLSISFSRRFVEPLLELKKRVNNIIAGSGDATSYNYPNNEIGTIAKDIEKLTENGLYNKNVELQSINKKLQVLSTTDQLTRLYNRHKLHEELEKEWRRAIRYSSPFSIVLFDIDWFKKVNDKYGHQTGDVVLKELAQLTLRQLRSSDTVGRWGGEEFLILCPEVKIDEAYELAEKLRAGIKQHQFVTDLSITISAGVHELSAGEDIAEMIKRADEKLYKAKDLGRNRTAR